MAGNLDNRRRSEERPRLAVLAHGIHDDGGMERAFAQLVRRVHDRYDVVVLSIDLAEPLRELVEWRRIRAPARPAALRFLVYYVVGWLRLATVRADLVQALGAIVPNRVDLASVHFCNAGYVDAAGGYAPRNAPLVRRLNTALARAVGLLAERWSFRPGRVSCLAPVSEGLARELRRHYPGIPIEVAPNGIDRARFRPDPSAGAGLRAELGLEESDLVVLFVGGDWHGKGLGLAIEAVAVASAGSPQRLRLLVVGRGDETYFRRLAERAGIGGDVVFAGSRRDTERFYAGADVFVLPSWYETFSLAAFEAASSGLPVVAPAVHGVEELVGDDAAGFVVDRTVPAIADALAALARSPELRRKLGEAALARSAQYTWERSLEATESIYRSLLLGDDARAVGVPA
jgi:glycosyltransferase involved in cell wall biosynthesis